MKNINQFPKWDRVEMVQYIKSIMQEREVELMDVTIVTFQHENDESEYFEVIESNIEIDAEDTQAEVFEKIIDNEKVVKSYKTQKGLVQACINRKMEKNMNEFVMYNQI